MEKNPKIDDYFINGCMRCPFGGTTQCKVNTWRQELILLREIVLETGLLEELKWSVPVYTYKGKNVVTVSALKDFATIGFFKGVLIDDQHQLLQQQGNLQSSRIIKFTNLDTILQSKLVIQDYIQQAISIEERGEKVILSKDLPPLPEELEMAFEADEAFKNAFFALTLGRQRGYIYHFSQPKQSSTRHSRILKYKDQIMNGIGLHDKYS